MKKSVGKQPLIRLRTDNTKVNLSEITQENGMWKELVQDCIQWQVLVLAVLELSDSTVGL
jgi:16S rRNA G527 N7-methylase RsmG